LSCGVVTVMESPETSSVIPLANAFAELRAAAKHGPAR